MSQLREYIEKIREYKEQNPQITDEKLIRYVYLDLGKRFSFNLDFAFGNSKAKQKIYARGRCEKFMNESMESNIMICKDISYILEHILREFGINIRTEVDPDDKRKCAHVYNVVTPEEGMEYIIDLQEDIENIQAHAFTTNYGLSTDSRKPIMRRFDIEQIDRELGYIDDEHYYTDDYMYTLKLGLSYFTDFAEKVQFALENIDIHENPNIQYAERQWRHKKMLSRLFTPEELRRIHIVDCYQQLGEQKEYKNCIAVECNKSTDMYMYVAEENRYCKMTIQEFAEMTQNGLVNMQGIPNLRQALRELKKKKDDVDDLDA